MSHLKIKVIETMNNCRSIVKLSFSVTDLMGISRDRIFYEVTVDSILSLEKHKMKEISNKEKEK